MTWLWRFVDGAKSAGELYGRVLVVFRRAAQRLPARAPHRQAPRVDPATLTARKAFEKITKKILPATYAQLQRALSAEAKTCRQRVNELDCPPALPHAAATVDVDELVKDDAEHDVDDDRRAGGLTQPLCSRLATAARDVSRTRIRPDVRDRSRPTANSGGFMPISAVGKLS
jgi:hypothetical protein